MNKTKTKKYTFIDLFAGCGGLSEGFLQTGHYKSLAHVEWEKPMVDTLRNRLEEKWGYSKADAKKEVILFDIQKTEQLISGNWDDESVKKYGIYNDNIVISGGLKSVIGEKHVDLIIGGPPCQAYSIHGRATDKDSMNNDYRNYLFESFCKVVDEFRPEIFVFENVKGLLSAKPGGRPVRERIYEAFSRIGYDILSPEEMPSAVFDASQFNVPQVRPRIIILGIKRGSKFSLEELYTSIRGEKSNDTPTVWDAIGKLPPLYPLEKPIKIGRYMTSHTQCTDNHITCHEARNHSERDLRIFRDWISKDMNNISHKAMLDYYHEITGHTTKFQKYKSLDWNKPSHTIVAHLSKDGYMFIHPDIKQQRSITVREAACLQSFPLDYNFLGSKAYNYKMIGNAVPVKFAYSIAEGLYKILKKEI